MWTRTHNSSKATASLLVSFILCSHPENQFSHWDDKEPCGCGTDLLFPNRLRFSFQWGFFKNWASKIRVIWWEMLSHKPHSYVCTYFKKIFHAGRAGWRELAGKSRMALRENQRKKKEKKRGAQSHGKCSLTALAWARRKKNFFSVTAGLVRMWWSKACQGKYFPVRYLNLATKYKLYFHWFFMKGDIDCISRSQGIYFWGSNSKSITGTE